MKKIITLSREFGAGAGEIGRRVAKELDYDYVDKELIIQTARSANVDVERILHRDEEAPTIFGFTQSLFDMYGAPLDERLFAAQKEIIRKIGEHGRCVIVGRNANSILSEFDDSLHVFIHAEERWRANRLKEKYMPDSTYDQIIEKMKAVDKKRRKYCSYYTNTEFGDARSYDLCLCSSSLGIDECVSLVCNIARG